MKLLFKLLVLMLMVFAAQADSIAIIQLQNRPAVEVIHVVKPMLGANDAISGQGFKIFLRSSPETLAQVKDMIKALDIASKTLQISVFQGSTRGISELGISGNIEVEGGDANISIGTRRSDNGNAGSSITFSTNNGSGSIDGTSTRIRLNDDPIHQIRVAEGTEAYIETGKQIPIFSGTNSILPEGIVGSIEYKDVVTGFYVLPRIHGDSVTLQISPFKNSHNNAGGGSIETQYASTTITGRIGEWLLVGGVTEQLKRKQSGIGSHISTQSRNNESIWIKADLIQ
ncbi:MAG: type II and III secretion system protein [Gammaproteobacteria bacterium]|nr:type II and III secretion system protein [Gammaproteobacteria bacterium]MDH3536691.1 type II and III secretion system protein [Gammaproteobacteria bacterium]